ncbi:MAG: Rossmann-like and DUF2520 domain-containing protein [Alphaproteobacteria bacterium]
MPNPKVSIIGSGVLGKAIGRLLSRKRYAIHGIAAGSHASAREAAEYIGKGRAANTVAGAARGADIVFLTTPDKAIHAVCSEIAEKRAFKRVSVVLHCSGAYGMELLAPARERHAHVGALHPVQSFASADVALKRMKGTFFTFDGDEAAAAVVAGIVKALGGRMLSIQPRDRALYHAALCVLSNYLVTIADLGLGMLEVCGLGREDALRAIVPLVEGTVENIAALDAPGALTGPIARGDAATVERHLEALATFPHEVRRLYCELGQHAVRVARRKGTLNTGDALHIVQMLKNASRR